jgi:UDP-glucose 4-epimerase
LGEDHSPETHLIPNVLKSALGSRGELEVFGDDYPTPDGTCVRDYVHIADIADAHEKAIRLLKRHASEKINLGNGTGFSVLDVIKTAERITGKTIPYEVSARREGDPAVLVAGAEKAGRVLDWRPAYASLESIVESAWKWHLEHPDGYGS